MKNGFKFLFLLSSYYFDYIFFNLSSSCMQTFFFPYYNVSATFIYNLEWYPELAKNSMLVVTFISVKTSQKSIELNN